MLTKTIKPGDSCFVLDEFVNIISEKKADTVNSVGVIFNDGRGVTNWGLLFDNCELAVDGMIARAENNVREAEKKFRAAEVALRRLKLKCGR